jgi:hypothetical protein
MEKMIKIIDGFGLVTISTPRAIRYGILYHSLDF